MLGCLAFAQQTLYKIEGTVIDRNTREPLEFVNVLVVGLNIAPPPMRKAASASNKSRRASMRFKPRC